jgi:putative ABC transport system substrate-binding protein
MNRREFVIGGAAAAWPMAARAQRALPVIGFMSSRSRSDSVHLVKAFHQGLNESGFVEGRNVVIEYRWGEGDYDRLPALADELVSLRVTVLVAVGGDPSAQAAKKATSTIPIVFGAGSDPVATGLVASINRPGGNITGVNVLTNQLEPKRLGLLKEIVPQTPLIGVLLNHKFFPAARMLQEIEEAARTINQRLFVAKASSVSELEAGFVSLAQQGVGAVLVAADPYYDSRREQIVALAAQQRLPAMYQFREYVMAGGLVSYGVSLAEGYRQFGLYAAKILKGENPADLPVISVVKTELVINLKIAKGLGFEFPPTLSARADEVIE